MRRTTLTRRTPLSRGKPLRRRAPINPTNKERRAARRAEQFGERAPLVRAMQCLCASSWRGIGCAGEVQACHVRSRGAGGTRRDLVPLCRGHHREQHSHGIATFQAKYGLDLDREAGRIAKDLDQQGIP